MKSSENEDDARVVTVGQKQKLEENSSAIRGYLKKALELELNKSDLKFNIQPGIVLNISDYINGLCKEYDVKIEK